MIGFGEAVVDAMQKTTDPIKRVATEAGGWPPSVLRQVGELDSAVGEDGVDPVRNSRKESIQERRSGSHVRKLNKFHEGERRGTIDGREKVQLAFGSPHFGKFDVKVANRISLELIPAWPAAVPFQTAKQRRPGQLRDGRLQGVKTIIEG